MPGDAMVTSCLLDTEGGRAPGGEPSVGRTIHCRRHSVSASVVVSSVPASSCSGSLTHITSLPLIGRMAWVRCPIGWSPVGRPSSGEPCPPGAAASALDASSRSSAVQPLDTRCRRSVIGTRTHRRCRSWHLPYQRIDLLGLDRLGLVIDPGCGTAVHMGPMPPRLST